MIVSRSTQGIYQLVFDTLVRKKVVILPCDTIYGIVGVVPDTISRIARIKKRPAHKQFIQLIPDESWLKRIVRTRVPRSLLDMWPGPITLILASVEMGSVAVRIPSDNFLRRLITDLDRPLVSTSVNSAGNPSLNRIRQIADQFENVVDLIIDAGDFTNRLSSTIVDLSRYPYRMLRKGAAEIPASLMEELAIQADPCPFPG